LCIELLTKRGFPELGLAEVLKVHKVHKVHKVPVVRSVITVLFQIIQTNLLAVLQQ